MSDSRIENSKLTSTIIKSNEEINNKVVNAEIINNNQHQQIINSVSNIITESICNETSAIYSLSENQTLHFSDNLNKVSRS